MVATVRRNSSLTLEGSFTSHQGLQALRKLRPVYSPAVTRRSGATARRTRGSTTWMCVVHIRGWHDRGHGSGWVRAVRLSRLSTYSAGMTL